MMRCFVVVCLLLLGVPVAARSAGCAGEYETQVTGIKNTYEFTTRDAIPVVLSGIQGFDNDVAGYEAFSGLLSKQPVKLRFVGEQPDKENRCVAEVWNNDGKWVQKEMLKAGHAYVYQMRASSDWDALLDTEEKARKRKKGVWKDSGILYNVDNLSNIYPYLHTYQIVEGKIGYIRPSGRVALICYGADPNIGLCVLPLASIVQKLKEQGTDLLSAHGRTLRARGFVLKRESGIILFIDNAKMLTLDGKRLGLTH